ncbi:inositol-1-monophosphatase [Rheinheimera sp. F8]|jgi:myo-inositol-1(or 4)-monophosphatase|uniref:Inositol-1-monophosphatase n=1 Tax=Rheinheimera tilapiae TaxID=875043 RepID=A0ABV6BAT9_9GAMM|nr:inositol-1-monophosphatase [Rheinheimera sp. F8]ALZ75978.1 inositol monophosphatase [Rheinheimera sp. F8]
MHPMLNIAVRAARGAGNIIARACGQLDMVQTSQKGTNDFVTNVDKEAEQAIVQILRKSYPTHDIVGEEGGDYGSFNSEYQWIIDPLDGTANFIKGIPHFAVSIALRHNGKLDQAVIYDPLRGEVFTASRGGGAQLNGRRIRVTNATDLTGTILATGFPFKQKHHLDAYTETFKTFFTTAADVRRSGSAALDLAYVAAGRLDGFWEIGLKPWDIAAGELIVREAGGLVSDFVGGNNQLKSGNVVAGNPKVLAAMLKGMRPHLTESLMR